MPKPGELCLCSELAAKADVYRTCYFAAKNSKGVLCSHQLVGEYQLHGEKWQERSLSLAWPFLTCLWLATEGKKKLEQMNLWLDTAGFLMF